MAAPTSPVELIDWLEANQLLQPEQVRELRPLLPTFPDVKVLARELVRREWLTPFQANQIAQDRGDQLVLGVFRLRERLGEGAMGQVFKAWNTRLQKVVAVKTLHKELVANARAMDRFRQEIEAAAQLDHPNIVQVRDADEIDSRPFMVMEYVDGVNLAWLVKTEGPLPVHVAAECIRQAALGLQHAFERGVIHRDIKPANLLLQSADHELRTTDFCVKILDFGLARFDSERRYSTRLTQPGSTLGTVDYMAPEQAESARAADTRADIYGLGCTLFFLLTGQPPFPGTSAAEKIGARLTGDPPRVRDERPDTPEGLERLLLQMMARHPADRPQTPAEVAAEMDPYTVPVTAAPTEVPAAIAKPVAPHEVAPEGQVPLALPVDVGPVSVSLPPASEGLFPVEGPNPFSLSDSDGALATGADAINAPAGRNARAARQGGLDRRLVVAIGASVIAMSVLIVGCGGYLLMGWLGTGAKTNAYGPGAEVLILEAFLSSGDELPAGTQKNVIVKFRRNSFDGPVELRLEGLPPGLVSEPAVARSGITAVEVPVTAPFGIAPSETQIRVIATAKNLTAEKSLKLRVGPDKGPRYRP
jgi:serine/threonine protein kinase